MGAMLVALGALALMCSHSKRYGWERDCVIGGIVGIVVGLVLIAAEVACK